MTSKGVLCCVKHRNVIYQDLSLTHYQATYTQAGLVYEGKPRTKSSTRHCGISFCRFVVTTPQIQVSLCRFRLSLRHRCLFVPLSALWFVVVSFRFFIVPFRHVIIVSSLRMNRVDLGTILTTLNMAAIERGATSDELRAFIRSNIQQILNGVNNNLMEEKDGINYLCATIDRLLDIINRKRKSKADKQCKEYILFYPIFRKALLFFIMVLQTVAFANWDVTISIGRVCNMIWHICCEN